MRTLNFSHLLIYVLLLFGGVLLWLLSYGQFLANHLIFSFGFLYILLLPGFAISRLLSIKENYLSHRLLLYFIFGLSFYFIIIFFGILSGIGLQVFANLIIVLLILIFIAGFLCDWLRKDLKISRKIEFHFHLSELLYCLVFAIALFILWLVYLKGPNLNGDPYFHLAIIRKALEGDSLSVRSLAFTKNLSINPAYAYPVWHVFLAFLSRIFSLNIFTTWGNIIFPLTVISFFSWYYLAYVIFEKKFFAILALIFWMIFVVYGGPGYLFTRIGVPDTMASLILLPLGLGLIFKYIFTKDLSRIEQQKFLIVSFLAALLLLALHGIHYFYLLLPVFAFGIFYAVFYFKSGNYKQTLWKIAKVLLVELSILVLLGAVLELRSGIISAAVSEFNKSSIMVISYSSFSKLSLVYKYSFFLLPLILVWHRPRWWLVGICMLLVPLIYFTPLKDISIRFLSIVFTDRLLANLAWYFFVFAVIVGVVLYLINLFIGHLSKNIRIIVNVITSLVFFGFVIWEIKNQAVSDFTYKIFYAKPTDAFVNSHYLWFLLISLFLTAMLLFAQFIWQKKPLLTFTEDPQNHITMFLLVLIISFVLISPSIINVCIFLTKPKVPSGEDYFLIPLQNDRSALEFVQKKIPQKSVILASSSVSKGLSTLSNQYMAYNVGSAYEKKFDWVLKSQNPDASKTDIITSDKWAIDYIYLENPLAQNSHFRLHPELYELVYLSKTEIYKIIK